MNNMDMNWKKIAMSFLLDNNRHNGIGTGAFRGYFH